MSGHTATTLAFVRTDAGVVRVDPKGNVPDGALVEHVAQLLAAGVLVDADQMAVIPARSASKSEWVAFATDEERGVGRLEQDAAEALTRDQLAERFLVS